MSHNSTQTTDTVSAIKRWLQARLRRPWFIVLGVVLALPVLGFSIDRLFHYNRVLRGVWVDDVALSGLDAGQARRALARLAERRRQQAGAIKVAGRVFTLRPAEVSAELEVERSLERALAAGRAGGPLSQFGWWLGSWFAPAVVPASVQLDRRRLERLIDGWERDAIRDPPVEAGVAVKQGKLSAVAPRSGQRVERGAAQALIEQRFGSAPGAALDLPLSLTQAITRPEDAAAAVAEAHRLCDKPLDLVVLDADLSLHFEPADLYAAIASRVRRGGRDIELYFDAERLASQLAALKKQVETPPRDARFVVDAHDRVSLVPSRSGTRVVSWQVAEALMFAAQSPARIAELPLERGAQPELTTDQALALGIKGLVSKFTTFHACCQPRVKNIHRIADLLNGVIVKPGETFSVNAYVGPRTRKSGFVAAPSIEDGEMVDTVGGGISQFATTFFNVVFHGGYDIIERQPHTYYFTRYPMGHEATLSFPKPDLIFKNDTAAGVLIETSYGETFITIKLFGDNGGRKVSAKVSDKIEIVKPPVELIANDELEPDREKVKEGGMIGWSVIVARELTFPDGSNKVEKRKVTYKPRVRRVEVHSCRIPEGEPGYTGEKCPVPEEDAGVEAQLPEVLPP